MRVYTFPINYSEEATNSAPEISDGRTDTFSASSTYTITFTESKTFDAVFCETTGFTSVNAGGISGTLNQAKDLRAGRYYGHASGSAVSGTSVSLSFGGTGRVYRVALVKHLFSIDEPNWTQIAHRRIGQGDETRTNVEGNSVVIPNRSGRWKWATQWRGYFPPNTSPDENGNPSVEQILGHFEANENFFLWPLPLADEVENAGQADEIRTKLGEPTIFYPAAINPASISVDYVGQLLSQRELTFTTTEL